MYTLFQGSGADSYGWTIKYGQVESLFSGSNGLVLLSVWSYGDHVGTRLTDIGTMEESIIQSLP